MVNTSTEVSKQTTIDQAEKFAWTKYAAAICGIWLLSNAFVSDKTSSLQGLNDITCGALICILSLVSLGKERDWLRWLVAILGTWQLFAPLFLWAPTIFHYDGSTFIGAMVIAFSFLIPGQPGERRYAGPDIPPGWSYNPSAWEQRAPLIAIAFFGFFLARYLAAYQLGYIESVWDPFFGNGTQKVLESEVSKAFMISDAGLGAVSYLIDGLEGFLGGRSRWRTAPWAVIVFTATIVPAGVTSIVLVMLQPISVGAWCTICLTAAAAMLVMVPFAFDELVATTQFLIRSKKRGDPFLHALIFGGTDEATADERRRTKHADRGFTGVNFPITLILTAAIGVWIMASPAVAAINGSAANSQHLIGALIVTLAITAMAEACRAVRWINIIAAAWLMISLMLLPGFSEAAAWTNIASAVALFGLSIPKGKITERYGSFDRFIF
jgi:hypothetical protein